MAGDENQLGPRTSSKNPAISTSLFERLFARSIYTSHPLSRHKTKAYNTPPILTKAMLPMPYPAFTNLTRNYRSHPSILSVPSTLFYNDTLIPEAVAPLTSPLLSWSGWRGRKWPVLFRCNTSLDEIERDGGGWYNPLEARVACGIAARLIGETGVSQRDICIMSPFSAQVRVLRNLMRSGELGGSYWDVNIGPAEAFQGLESRVVILCTTRTRPRFLPSDALRNLGIMHQPKRLNVALTRAKEALVVIGNPQLLVLDPNWSAFLAMCWRNGLWEDEEGGVGGVRLDFLGKEDGGGEDGDGNGKDGDGNMKAEFEGKVGLLEKALIRKEEEKVELVDGNIARERSLGDGAIRVEDEMWAAGLRLALEEAEVEDEEGLGAYGDEEEEEEEEQDGETDMEEGEGEGEGGGR